MVMKTQRTAEFTTSPANRARPHCVSLALGTAIGALLCAQSAAAQDVGAARMWQPGFTIGAGNWQVGQNPRFMADIDGDDKDDLVAFSNTSVRAARSTGSAFVPHGQIYSGFTHNWGRWRAEKNPRFVQDVNGDGMADIVGLSNSGVVVALSQGTDENGNIKAFAQATHWSTKSEFPPADGTLDPLTRNPRMMADVNGDGKSDFIHFDPWGVVVGVAGEGKFIYDDAIFPEWFGSGRTTGLYGSDDVRVMADLDGDNKSDIVGYQWDSVLDYALAGGDGVANEVESLAFPSTHPPLVADVNGDGKRDVVGFDEGRPFVSLWQGGGLQSSDMSWGRIWSAAAIARHERTEDDVDHPRFVDDVDGDGNADIVTFTDVGVYTAFAIDEDNDGKIDAFDEPTLMVRSYMHTDSSSSWQAALHLRMLADIDGTGKADIVGFGGAGIFVSRYNRDLVVFD